MPVSIISSLSPNALIRYVTCALSALASRILKKVVNFRFQGTHTASRARESLQVACGGGKVNTKSTPLRPAVSVRTNY